MQRFYDIKRVEQQPLPSAVPTPRLPVDHGAGLPNSTVGNDYRNRMPFHFVDEQTGEDFFGWQYGQTMELFITFAGEPDLEQQPFVTDVLQTTKDVPNSTKSVVDKATKIANFELGSMAFTDVDVYAKKDYFAERMTAFLTRLNSMRSTAVITLNLLAQMQAEIDKGDEMNSKLIEELQHQIVVLREDLNKRIDGLEKKFNEENEALKKKLEEGLAKVDDEVTKCKDTFTFERTWKFTTDDWRAEGGHFHFEKTLPIDDAANYDITASITIEETYQERNIVSYATGHTFNWFVRNKNQLVIYTAEPKPDGLLSVYMTKKNS